ncbi:queuosine precursor transporter [Qipengyuania gelatinilytica]|uniref:Probable queuosine precursor transporter n=1 Tax=Qipengyuania gelatinilytica TaxID=2867231 RepID=A0ABX9A7J6_9SPHN|nr:queuosine precursor transporter [Qipengyuania gelatinilytica]QZD96274.1 queuosine precursor transporter [Qipengyuania gelatinilytica]
MTDQPANETRLAAAAMPLGLFVYTLLYGGMTVLAGVLAYKQSQLWNLNLPDDTLFLLSLFDNPAVESGIFAFLLLVVITSTIAQLYGEKLANRLVLFGFVPLAFSIALMWLVLALPVSPEMVSGRPGAIEAFEMVHGQFWRVVASGPVAYLVSLLLNIWIFSRLRGYGEANTLGLMVRGAIASALSQAIDSVIFVTLAFYGEFDITDLLVGQVFAKVTLSIILVPFLITGGVAFAKWLDRRNA